jgi:hypothetical protein
LEGKSGRCMTRSQVHCYMWVGGLVCLATAPGD